MPKTAEAILDPMSIKRIGNRSVIQVHHFGDGLVGFRMNVTEDGKDEISNGLFWEALEYIRERLKSDGFDYLPEATMPLLAERIGVKVDMVIPMRKPTDRRNFLKADYSRDGRLKKTPFVQSLVYVQGPEFVFVVKDPTLSEDEKV